MFVCIFIHADVHYNYESTFPVIRIIVLVFFPAPNNESVLQKFRKTISLHFAQRKSSKDSCASDDTASETVLSEEESSPHHTGTSSERDREYTTQKHR